MGIDEDVANAYDNVRVKLTFSKCLIQQPLIYEMAQVYDVSFSIRHAAVELDEGWVILDINGTNENIDQALYWLYEHGVTIDLTLPFED